MTERHLILDGVIESSSSLLSKEAEIVNGLEKDKKKNHR